MNKYLDEIEEFCEAYKVTLDEGKIVIAIKYMEYETRKSLEKFGKEVNKSWEAFKKKLKAAFRNSNEERTAEQQLYNLC